MSEKNIPVLIEDILREQTLFQNQVEKWQSFYNAALKYNLAHPADHNLSLKEKEMAALEMTRRDAGDPPMGYELGELYEELSQTVYHQVYKKGASAAPELLALENSDSTYSILRLSDIAVRTALRNRFDNGLSSLPETVAAYDELNRKGYIQFGKNGTLAVAGDATVEEEKRDFIAGKLAIQTYRERVIGELGVWPPTENSRATAEVFLQYPEIVKALPYSTWHSDIKGSPEEWLKSAAQLAPETALEMRDELVANGFEDAVKEAEKTWKQSSLIQFNPTDNTQYAGLQNTPDARRQKIVSSIG